VIIIIPLILSSFTHLWNAAGFPDLFYDEGVYMLRAMNVLYYHDVQENPYYYDHPPFGQIFLAGLLAITGYPNSLNPSSSVESIQTLYLVPKIWMGILAVIDTFLIYKIVQYRYNNQRVALLAALLFAVMPMGWLMRRILLESLLLPFLLTSIMLAVRIPSSGKNQNVLILLSGAFLGLAIFTKIPVFTMIPLVSFMVYNGSKENKLRRLGLWFIPVVLIPLLWPAQSMSTGSFEDWITGVVAQTQRQSAGILTVFWGFLVADPLLFALGILGLRYAVLRKDLFVLLWFGPFMIFLWLIGYVQYFHSIPIIPVFCISAALWLQDVVGRIKSRRYLVRYGVFASIVIFGLTSTTLVIITNVTSAQFDAIAFVLLISDKDTTIISNPVYAWPYTFVFDMPYAMNDYRDVLYSDIPTDKIVLVSEPHLLASIHEARLKVVYDDTASVRVFYSNVRSYNTSVYPYTNMMLN
ncbi:MAG: glycosyltransferase family 39 protein, partial [Nitrososphaera sp.]